MSGRRTCSECGRSLDGLMSADPTKPGFLELLRGAGSDRCMRWIAHAAALLGIFGAAVLLFWALTAAIS